MTSNLFTQLGLQGMDIGILFLVLAVLILILFILLIVTITKQSNLKKRYESFMMGNNGRSMEEEIRNLFYDIDYLKKETDTNKKEIRHIYRKLETVFQKVGLVKYDALHQMGGKLSFALALLDEKNNGFLMNSVHSTEGSYCYIKEIHDGSCEIELSMDEQKALMQALDASYTLSKKATRSSSDSVPSPEKKKPRRTVEPVYEEEPAEEYEEEEDDLMEDPDLLEAEALIAGLSDQKPLRVATEQGEGVFVKKKAAQAPAKKQKRIADSDPEDMSHVSVKRVARRREIDSEE
ncbi:MAG: DUF4446 family protein [Lachnospiraceae bacterium]|nr:DUF4446 family protein [Lachnospiraceae bacterium]